MNPLLAIYNSYHALDVARRVAREAAKESAPYFHGTFLDGMLASDVVSELDQVSSELEDLAIVSLYAAFEVALREIVEAKAEALPGRLGLRPGFESDLFRSVTGWSSRLKMEDARRLFHESAGHEIASKAGKIERYRHWVAHGRRGVRPSHVGPDAAFETLVQFLKVATEA